MIKTNCLLFDMRVADIENLSNIINRKKIKATVLVDKMEGPTMLSGSYYAYVRLDFDSDTEKSLFAIYVSESVIDRQIRFKEYPGNAYDNENWVEYKGIK
jgi:hypothetical protein